MVKISDVESHQNISACRWKQIPDPMIMPGPEVTMETAWLSQPSPPLWSNPAQIRYDHHTARVNPDGLYDRKTDKLTVVWEDSNPPKYPPLQKDVFQTPSVACRPSAVRQPKRNVKKKRGGVPVFAKNMNQTKGEEKKTVSNSTIPTLRRGSRQIALVLTF